jgi:hypothetical protein
VNLRQSAAIGVDVMFNKSHNNMKILFGLEGSTRHLLLLLLRHERQDEFEWRTMVDEVCQLGHVLVIDVRFTS